MEIAVLFKESQSLLQIELIQYQWTLIWYSGSSALLLPHLPPDLLLLELLITISHCTCMQNGWVWTERYVTVTSHDMLTTIFL